MWIKKDFQSELELRLLRYIETGRFPKGLSSFLSGASLAYKWGVLARHRCYERHWLRRFVPSTVVISVGNIVAGGSGKTPFVRYLAQDLESIGKVAILLRGYRSFLEKNKRPVLLDRAGILTHHFCSDEAKLLLEDTKAHIIVGKNRVFAEQLAASLDIDYVILDDGMQYRRLERDMDIAVLHGNDPFGRGSFLPKGLLRDTPKRLKHMDYIVLTHVQSQCHMDTCEAQLRFWSDCPVIGMRYVTTFTRAVANQRVALFYGLGAPCTFIENVQKAGGTIVRELRVPDHKAPSFDALHAFACDAKAQGAQMLVCTKKDFVKIQGLGLPLPLSVACIQPVVVYGKHHYEQLKQDCIDKKREQT